MDLPSGIVTFLFTDIEGSTRQVEVNQDSAFALIRRHNQVLRDAIEQHNGYVVNKAGNEYAVSFHTAMDALLTAIAAQTALLHERWADDMPVRIHMALHTGPAQAVDGSYIGPTINRAARLLSGTWGGQIVLSGATRSQLLDDLPADVQLLDLGPFLLEQAHEEHVYQVIARDLPTNFGPPPV